MPDIIGVAVIAAANLIRHYPQFATGIYAVGAITVALPYLAPTANQTQHWLQKGSTTENEDIPTIINSILSKTVEPVVTINTERTSPNPLRRLFPMRNSLSDSQETSTSLETPLNKRAVKTSTSTSKSLTSTFSSAKSKLTLHNALPDASWFSEKSKTQLEPEHTNDLSAEDISESDDFELLEQKRRYAAIQFARLLVLVIVFMLVNERPRAYIFRQIARGINFLARMEPVPRAIIMLAATLFLMRIFLPYWHYLLRWAFNGGIVMPVKSAAAEVGILCKALIGLTSFYIEKTANVFKSPGWCPLTWRWIWRIPTIVFFTTFCTINSILVVETFPQHFWSSLIVAAVSFAAPYLLSFHEAVGGLDCNQDYVIIIMTVIVVLVHFCAWEQVLLKLQPALETPFGEALGISAILSRLTVPHAIVQSLTSCLNFLYGCGKASIVTVHNMVRGWLDAREAAAQSRARVHDLKMAKQTELLEALKTSQEQSRRQTQADMDYQRASLAAIIQQSNQDSKETLEKLKFTKATQTESRLPKKDNPTPNAGKERDIPYPREGLNWDIMTAAVDKKRAREGADKPFNGAMEYPINKPTSTTNGINSGVISGPGGPAQPPSAPSGAQQQPIVPVQVPTQTSQPQIPVQVVQPQVSAQPPQVSAQPPQVPAQPLQPQIPAQPPQVPVQIVQPQVPAQTAQPQAPLQAAQNHETLQNVQHRATSHQVPSGTAPIQTSVAAVKHSTTTNGPIESPSSSSQVSSGISGVQIQTQDVSTTFVVPAPVNQPPAFTVTQEQQPLAPIQTAPSANGTQQAQPGGGLPVPVVTTIPQTPPSTSSAVDPHRQVPHTSVPPRRNREMLNLDEFPLPALYGSRDSRPRDPNHIESAEQMRNRLLGGPSILTLMRRQKEQQAAGGNTGDPPSGPSGAAAGSGAPDGNHHGGNPPTGNDSEPQAQDQSTAGQDNGNNAPPTDDQDVDMDKKPTEDEFGTKKTDGGDNDDNDDDAPNPPPNGGGVKISTSATVEKSDTIMVDAPRLPSTTGSLAEAGSAMDIDSVGVPAVVLQPPIQQPTIPQPIIPQPSFAQPIIPQPTVPQPTVPQPIIPQPTVPQPTIPQPAIPKPSVAKPTIPQPAIPKPSVPQGTTPKKLVPKKVLTPRLDLHSLLSGIRGNTSLYAPPHTTRSITPADLPKNGPMSTPGAAQTIPKSMTLVPPSVKKPGTPMTAPIAQPAPAAPVARPAPTTGSTIKPAPTTGSTAKPVISTGSTTKPALSTGTTVNPAPTTTKSPISEPFKFIPPSTSSSKLTYQPLPAFDPSSFGIKTFNPSMFSPPANNEDDVAQQQKDDQAMDETKGQQKDNDAMDESEDGQQNDKDKDEDEMDEEEDHENKKDDDSHDDGYSDSGSSEDRSNETLIRPKTAKVQLNSGQVINNPEYWHKKKVGIKKIETKYGLGTKNWREIPLRAYKEYKEHGDSQKLSDYLDEIGMKWFDELVPDAEEAEWDEDKNYVTDSIDTDEATDSDSSGLSDPPDSPTIKEFKSSEIISNSDSDEDQEWEDLLPQPFAPRTGMDIPQDEAPPPENPGVPEDVYQAALQGGCKKKKEILAWYEGTQSKVFRPKIAKPKSKKKAHSGHLQNGTTGAQVPLPQIPGPPPASGSITQPDLPRHQRRVMEYHGRNYWYDGARKPHECFKDESIGNGLYVRNSAGKILHVKGGKTYYIPDTDKNDNKLYFDEDTGAEIVWDPLFDDEPDEGDCY